MQDACFKTTCQQQHYNYNMAQKRKNTYIIVTLLVNYNIYRSYIIVMQLLRFNIYICIYIYSFQRRSRENVMKILEVE